MAHHSPTSLAREQDLLRTDRPPPLAIMSESIRFSSPRIFACRHGFELVVTMSITDELFASVNLLKVKFKSLPLYFNWHQVPNVFP